MSNAVTNFVNVWFESSSHNNQYMYYNKENQQRYASEVTSYCNRNFQKVLEIYIKAGTDGTDLDKISERIVNTVISEAEKFKKYEDGLVKSKLLSKREVIIDDVNHFVKENSKLTLNEIRQIVKNLNNVCIYTMQKKDDAHFRLMPAIYLLAKYISMKYRDKYINLIKEQLGDDFNENAALIPFSIFHSEDKSIEKDEPFKRLQNDKFEIQYKQYNGIIGEVCITQNTGNISEINKQENIAKPVASQTEQVVPTPNQTNDIFEASVEHENDYQAQEPLNETITEKTYALHMDILDKLQGSDILKATLERYSEHSVKVTQKCENRIFNRQFLAHTKTPNAIIEECKIDVDIGIVQSFFRNCKICKDTVNGREFAELKYKDTVVMKQFKN